MKLVLKEEELTGPFVMPHPFWTLLVTRWLLYLLIGFIQRENKLLIHVQWKVVLNLGVRLLPTSHKKLVHRGVIFFDDYIFQRDGSQVCEEDITGTQSWQETYLALKKIYTHFKEIEKELQLTSFLK